MAETTAMQFRASDFGIKEGMKFLDEQQVAWLVTSVTESSVSLVSQDTVTYGYVRKTVCPFVLTFTHTRI